MHFVPVLRSLSMAVCRCSENSLQLRIAFAPLMAEVLLPDNRFLLFSWTAQRYLPCGEPAKQKSVDSSVCVNRKQLVGRTMGLDLVEGEDTDRPNADESHSESTLAYMSFG
jgi:hypothetical protein